MSVIAVNGEPTLDKTMVQTLGMLKVHASRRTFQ